MASRDLRTLGVEVRVGDLTRRDTSEEQSELAARDAQTQFIQQHLRRIFLLIYRLVGNAEDAQDLTQETFIKALQRQSQVKDVSRSAHWLSRIATNTAIDHLRRSKRLPAEAIENSDWPASTDYTPEELLLDTERRTWLHGGLALLTERERTALLLRDVDDIPPAEVAREMGCSMATVRSHIANARLKFRRYLGAVKD